MPWEETFARGRTFAVESAGRGSGFASGAFAALIVKDAIVDRLRARWGSRPDVARERPDLLVHLHLAGERAGIALDSSGEPLSHRGYRPRGGPAPLAETLAAGVLLLAGYDGSQPLLDPMAGTGTIAIEAALIATRQRARRCAARSPASAGHCTRRPCSRPSGKRAARLRRTAGAARDRGRRPRRGGRWRRRVATRSRPASRTRSRWCRGTRST